MRNAEASALGELAPVAKGLSLGIEFPLVVDLDGTLIATDALHESLLFFLKRQGMAAWKIPFWILSGRAKVKNRLAAVVTEEDVATFPINDELLAVAEREAKRGRRVVLATAADLSIAEKVQRRFPCIFLWLARIWLLCHRGELHDDPVAFALKDGPSLIYRALMAAMFGAAIS